MQTAADIAYLEGFRQGSKTVWYLTVRLRIAYGIITLLLVTAVYLGGKSWYRY